jgi:hypothetical protein
VAKKNWGDEVRDRIGQMPTRQAVTPFHVQREGRKPRYSDHELGSAPPVTVDALGRAADRAAEIQRSYHIFGDGYSGVVYEERTVYSDPTPEVKLVPLETVAPRQRRVRTA